MDKGEAIEFIKNRYYPGKLLCSDDFNIEQKYIQNKFNTMNRLFFGSGIVNGLNAEIIHDGRLCINKGSFLDEKGRLIAIDKPVYLNEEQIMEFMETEPGYGCIVLKYKEEDISPIFEAFSEAEEQKEYRYRKELYTISIERLEPVKEADWFKEAFFQDVVIYEDKDLILTQSIPLFIPLDREFQLQLSLSSKKGNDLFCSLEYNLTADGFHCRETNGRLWFHKDNINVSSQKVIIAFHLSFNNYEYTDNAEDSIFCFSYKREDIKIILYEKLHNGLMDYKHFFKPPKGDYITFIKEKVQSLDASFLKQWDQFYSRICLGVLHFYPDRSGVKIHKLVTEGVRRYAAVPHIENLINHLFLQYGISSDSGRPAYGISRQEFRLWQKECMENQFQTGLITIDIPSLYKEQEVLYSKEVPYGLKYPGVYVRIGAEDFTSSSYKEREIVYGSQNLFHKEEFKGVKILEKAVRVFPYRGTFQVAVRIAEPVYWLHVNIRWFAFGIDEITKK